MALLHVMSKVEYASDTASGDSIHPGKVRAACKVITANGINNRVAL
jgi:hypothetical protein